MIKKLLCYLFGHKYFNQHVIQYPQSQVVESVCQRCGKSMTSQYDMV
jgi:hypothetical protein